MTHGVGAVLAVVGLVALVATTARRGDAWGVVAVAVYGATLVMLYLASTLYHACGPSRAKQVFQHLDHGCIYLLIAGTYTPFCLVPLRGPWGWTLFGLVWGLAVVGLVLDVTARQRRRRLSLVIYLTMGWLIVVAIRPLLAALPAAALTWLGLGGVFYTGGVAFYVLRRLRYHHAIWHGFVLAGSICHWVAIYRGVL